MSEVKQARERRFQLFGWALFLGCSLIFIVAGVVSRSPWGIAGGVVFLIGCIIFLIPFAWKK